MCDIAVYGMSGQRIVTQQGGESTLLDITAAPAGVYLLTVTINGKTVSFKIVKE